MGVVHQVALERIEVEAYLRNIHPLVIECKV